MKTYPWQSSQWQQLCDAFSKERLSHAILLNGQAGLGKFHFAKEFSKFILCADSNKQSMLQPCDICKSCKLINTEAHPDFHLITIEDASVIKIDQIKNLIAEMNHKAHYNGFKIAIIYPAEKMNTNAANALLKNLEEPIGSETLFLLVSDQFMLLPATIRSRCQRINFHVPNMKIVKEWLLSQSISTDDGFETACQLTEGAPLMLRQYLVEPELTDTKNLMQLLRTSISDKSTLISTASKQLAKFSLTDFLRCLQIIVSNRIKFNATLNKETLHTLLDEINQRKQAVENGIQLNTQLVIEDYLIKLKIMECV